MMISVFFLILASCNNPASKNEPIKNEPTASEPIKKENTVQQFKFDTTTLKSGQSYYQCPMDLEVISDKSGACPVCGMDLEAIIKH